MASPDEAATPLEEVLVETSVTVIEPLKPAFDELPSLMREPVVIVAAPTFWTITTVIAP